MKDLSCFAVLQKLNYKVTLYFLFQCRIHGDRSFHCEICGVCLDVQLRGNHKCREGSAHDECCICLEVLSY